MHGLVVRLVGDVVSIHRASGGVPVSGRAGLLLTRLARSPGTAVPSGELAALLWGADLPATSSASLQMHVSRLRRAFEGTPAAVRAVAGGYRLEVDEGAIDLFVVRAELRRARQAIRLDPGDAFEAASRARSLLGRRPYAPFDDAEGLRNAVAEAERLGAEVTEVWAEAALAAGRHREVVDELGSAAVDQPLREIRWALWIVALYRCGRQAEALDAYQQARTHLVGELGIEPGPDLRSLEEAVLLQRPWLDHHLSAPAEDGGDARTDRGGLIGRRGDLAAVQHLLDGHRIVTITGPPGVGKSALAAAAGARSSKGLLGRVALRRGLAGRTPEAEVARQLGLRPGPEPSDLLAVLIEHLAQRSGLVVLDDADDVRDAIGTLALRVAAVPGSTTVLVTSQRPLGVPGEVVLRLEPLATTTADGAVPPAVQLLGALVSTASAIRASAPGHEAVRQLPTLEELAALARLCDGLPLLLELVAAQVATVGAAAVLRTMENRGPGLAPASVRTAVATSLATMAEQAQRAAAAVAELPGPPDVALVAIGADLPAADAAAALVEVCDASLTRPHHDIGRVEMLPVIRSTVSSLATDEERRRCRHRMAMELAALAAGHGMVVYGTDEAVAEHLEPDRSNLSWAIGVLAEVDLHRAASMCCDLIWFAQLTGTQLELAETLHALAATARRDLAAPGAALALCADSLSGFTLSRVAERLPDAVAGLAAARAQGDALAELLGSWAVGIGLLWTDQDLDRAARLFDDLGRLGAAATGNPYFGVSGTEMGALVLVRRGQLHEGQELMAVARQRYRDLGSLRGLSGTYLLTTHVALMLGDVDSIEDNAGKLLELTETTGEEIAALHARTALARAAVLRGRRTSAIADLRTAVAGFDAVGDIGCALDATCRLADALLANGEREGLALACSALRRAHRQGDQGSLTMAGTVIAEEAIDSEQPNAAGLLIGLSRSTASGGLPIDHITAQRSRSVEDRLAQTMPAHELDTLMRRGSDMDPASILALWPEQVR